MYPDFDSKQFLRQHIDSILSFYDPNIDDPNGGFYQNFNDDGTVYDYQTRHLVSSCRFVFNYANAWLQFRRKKDLSRVMNGVSFLRRHHLNPETGGYAWLLDTRHGHSIVKDGTNHCYGLAFVLLAYSYAHRAGIAGAEEFIEETWQTMNRYFWDEKHGLYKDEYNSDFSVCSTYRGQNANMHSCEALIAAYNATGEEKFLTRAFTIAHNIVNTQTSKTDGLIWEHYNENWQVDWDYNKTDPKNLFRPWGYQPGHHTEWSKLLLMLNQIRPQPWLVQRAQALFDRAMALAWDRANGGICYGFSPNGDICDGDKYFWVQAETMAAASLLMRETGHPKYQRWYTQIWEYCWEHLIEH